MCRTSAVDSNLHSLVLPSAVDAGRGMVRVKFGDLEGPPEIDAACIPGMYVGRKTLLTFMEMFIELEALRVIKGMTIEVYFPGERNPHARHKFPH